jgi:hypothetical protein
MPNPHNQDPHTKKSHKSDKSNTVNDKNKDKNNNKNNSKPNFICDENTGVCKIKK